MIDCIDLDETRRLAVMAKIGLLSGRPLGIDLVGTLVHAVTYHQRYLKPATGVAFGRLLLQGNQRAVRYLDAIIEQLDIDLDAA